eukprot:Lithocolla_globosa_v1_NODE_2105_length_2166_cov_6.909522.p2 type:complete len:208 gc:universal NODE_2105_length_2166_cov_6.909522:1699-1076(-)
MEVPGRIEDRESVAFVLDPLSLLSSQSRNSVFVDELNEEEKLELTRKMSRLEKVLENELEELRQQKERLKSNSPTFWEDHFTVDVSKISSNGCLKKDVMLDVYKIGKLIGSGSGGVVMKAIHQETGEQVALKHVKPNSDTREFLNREIFISRLLRHDNIVQLRCLYSTLDYNDVYVVQEYVDGETLFDEVPRNGFSEQVIVLDSIPG